MNNEIKINVPEGMEIDRENSTFECIKFKPKKKDLPKTWKEFCENNPRKDAERYIGEYSDILGTVNGKRDSETDANVLPSEKYAEAMLALCKLIQLRDCYNNGWKPDWNSFDRKYIICYYCNEIVISSLQRSHCLLAFKTEDLRNTFRENFKDLIEQAKLLL